MPEIILHLPKKYEDICLLQKKVAQVHAEAVIRCIEKLQCPKAQKMVLLDIVKKGASLT
jgi:hypothetical protein